VKVVARLLLFSIVLFTLALGGWHYVEQKSLGSKPPVGDTGQIDSVVELYAAMEKTEKDLKLISYVVQEERQAPHERPLFFQMSVLEMGEKFRYEKGDGIVIGFNGEKLWRYSKNDGSIIIVDASEIPVERLHVLGGVEQLRNTFGTFPGRFDPVSDPKNYRIENWQGSHNIALVDKQNLMLVDFRTYSPDGSFRVTRLSDMVLSPDGIGEDEFNPVIETQNPGPAYVLWAELAYGAAEDEDYALAIEFFKKALAADPPAESKVSYLIALGESYSAQGQVTEALQYYRAASAVKDTTPEKAALAKHYEGCALANLGKEKEAITALEASLASGEHSLAAETYEVLGLSYFKLGDAVKSRELLEKCLATSRNEAQKERIKAYLRQMDPANVQ